MIRQAISCDVCGAEKRHTNHWFMAYRQGAELRVASMNGNSRLRAGSKHLCGQTCLHKLLDEFIAGTMSARPPLIAEIAEREEPIAATDASLTSKAAYASPASALSVPAPSTVRPMQVVPAALVAIAAPRTDVAPRAVAPSRAVDDLDMPAFEDPPNFSSRRWRAEAWERERERCSSVTPHRKTS